MGRVSLAWSTAYREADFSGRWVRIGTSCGERVSGRQLTQMALRAHDNMPVGASIRFDSQIDETDNRGGFEVSVYSGTGCRNPNAESDPSDFLQPYCGEPEINRGSYTFDPQNGMLRFHTSFTEGSNGWGRPWLNTVEVIREPGVLIFRSPQSAACKDESLPEDQQRPADWWMYWIVPSVG